jgi:flagellin
MAFKIVGNVDANRDLMYLDWNKQKVSHLQEQLSTGLRLVRASDNTNDLYIADQLKEIQTGMNKSISNMKQALAAVRIAEETTAKIYDLLVKVKETLIEIADTDSKDARKNALATIKGYLAQIAILANNAKYQDNEDEVEVDYNANLLKGAGLYVHTGPQYGQHMTIGEETVNITVALSSSTKTNLNIDSHQVKISFNDEKGDAPDDYIVELTGSGSTATTFTFKTDTNDDVENSLEDVERALQAIRKLQTFLGQAEEMLQNLVENQQYKMEQLHENESQLRDVDYAKAFAEMNKMNVVLQANVATLAQNNQINQLVTQLMR